MPTAVELGVDDVRHVVTTLYGLEGHERGRQYVISCPDPNHDDRTPSAAVSLDTGLWNCYSCSITGDLASLGVRVLERTRDEVLEMLQPSSPDAVLANIQRRIAALMPARQRKAKRVDIPQSYNEGPLTYLQDRGFSDVTLKQYGIQYVPYTTLKGHRGEFTIRHSIALPIRNEDGDVINWCYRATPQSPSWQPRYLYHTDDIKNQWFGIDQFHDATSIAVAEGALDSMWIAQCGFPALGLLGTRMTGKKLHALQRFRSVTLFLDRDSAGVVAVRTIGKSLGHLMPVYVARYDRRLAPGKKLDPQDLAPIDVEIALARRISWATFSLKQAS